MTSQRASWLLTAALITLTIASARAQTAPSTTDPTIAAPYQASWHDYLAMKAHPAPARLPDWSGIWLRTGYKPGPAVPFGTLAASDIAPLLTPRYAADFKQKLVAIDKGLDWDRLSACLPAGMPRWLTEPFMREFVPTRQVTWLIHEQISEVRRIYTNHPTHTAPGEVGPLWEGDSIGFWDGSTLVIHTIHMKAGQYQRGSPNFSFDISTLERMRSIDANTIEDVVKIYDPGSLTRPFTSRFLYARVTDPTARIQFASCEEGNNAVRAPDGSTTFVLPGEPGYNDPQTFGIPEVARDSLPR